MAIISLGDIQRGALAFFIILPTILLSIYLSSALQSYSLKGSDLWRLKNKNIPNDVIEPLHEIKSQIFFFKYKLMNEVESRILNPVLFQKYKQEIENQISVIPHPATEYYFICFLAMVYGAIGFMFKKLVA